MYDNNPNPTLVISLRYVEAVQDCEAGSKEMKIPIEVKDIYKGDLIRFESEVDYSQLRNMEYTAGRSRDGLEYYLNIPGRYYLLDRPVQEDIR